MAAETQVYPRVLDKDGCIFGRHLKEDVEMMRDTVKEMKEKIDRLTWALTAAAVTFGTAAVMLALNLLAP